MNTMTWQWVLKPKVFIPAIAIIAAGATAFVLLYHPSKKIVPYDTGTKSNIQTKQIELPNKKVAVVPHQVMAKIENQDTVKSFGDSIQTTDKKDVYIITVKTDDLLAAGKVIRQKPGVVWTTPVLESNN